MQLSTVLVLLFLIVIGKAEVSLTNLQAFWEATYDADKDGFATMQEFTEYFQIMESEHHITEADIEPIFKFFDADFNSKVTLKELIEVSEVKVTTKAGPKQIHIGLTNIEGEMQVMWASSPEFYNKPIVEFGRLPGELKGVVEGTWITYNVGHLGFHGRIYRAVIKGMEPLKRYYYRVGDAETRIFSKTKYFKSPPLKVQSLEEVNIAVFGDMGTYTPFGAFVTNQIVKDHFIRPYDFVFLTGDIAYAGVSKETLGELEPIWDLFGELTSKFAAYTPFMPGVGNH